MADSTATKTARPSRWDLLPEIRPEAVTYMAMFIYLILSVIFWRAGYTGKVFFLFLSLLLIALILLTMGRYVLTVAHAANNRRFAPGLLFAKGVFFFALPVLFLKIVVGILLANLPETYGGLTCDLICVIKNVFWTLQWQRSLWIVFWGSLVFLSIFIFDALRSRRA